MKFAVYPEKEMDETHGFYFCFVYKLSQPHNLHTLITVKLMCHTLIHEYDAQESTLIVVAICTRAGGSVAT